MEKVFSYRIVKIGGKAVSVALTLFGMAVGTAQAQNVYLGTQYSSQSGYLNSVGLYSAEPGGYASATHIEDGNSTALCVSCDDWSINRVSSGTYQVHQSRGGDIFYGNSVIFSVRRSLSDPILYTSKEIAEAQVEVLDFNRTFTATASRDSLYLANQFYGIDDTAAVRNYFFGSGAVVNNASRGQNADAPLVSLSGSSREFRNGQFTFDTGLAGGAETIYAINITGAANFSGNNTINGDARAASLRIAGDNSDLNGSVTALSGGSVRVDGNNNSFNGTVTAGTVDLYGNNTSFAGNVTVTNGLNFLNAVSASLSNGADILGNVNFATNDATLNLSDNSSINGNVTATGVNGTLVFEGAGSVSGSIGSSADSSLKEIRLGGADTVDLSHTTQAAVVNYVNYQAAATLTARGGLALNQGSAQNQVAFNQHDGALQVAGNLTGVRGLDVVTTTGNHIGTVTMVGGTQSATGNIGADGHAIKTLNIGGTGALSTEFNGDVASITTVSGNVYAQNIVLNNTNAASSELKMASGYNLTGLVSTAEAGRGILTLMGGTQSVNGTIGATGALQAVNAGAADAQATLNGNVFATHLNVTGTGTINLNGNFTGTAINYLADGTVNLGNEKTVNGAVTTGTDGNGTFTFVQNGVMGTGAGRNIGADGASLKRVNVGDAAGSTAGTVTTNTIWATTTAINNGSTLEVRSAQNINGAVTTETNNTGTLNLAGGMQAVSGNVGAAGASLATVKAGATHARTTFNGMVHATTLRFEGNGTVVLNGNNDIDRAKSGLVGTVDFQNSGTGELQIGNGVNLTTGADGIQFANANGATLRFNASSVVTGELGSELGSNTAGRSTFKDIYAGANGSIVTFTDKVYVAGTTFHVDGTGTVNFGGDLSGPLIFEADGRVNVANGKTILGNTTTQNHEEGTLNFVGGTTLAGNIGDRSGNLYLKAVNFHAFSSEDAPPLDNPTLALTAGPVVVNIGHDIAAMTTTIGNATYATTANITTNAFLGDALTLAAANVTVNTAQQDVNQVSAGTRIAGANPNTLTFNHTVQADGRLSTTAQVTNATTGAGVITTNGATLNFSVAAQPWAANAGGALDTTAASSITGGTDSGLLMNGSEKVNIALLGSLKNGQTHTLINVDTGTAQQKGIATDNSYVIDSELTRNAGDLVVTFSRDAQSYVTKSATGAHASQAAATRLGALAANGTSYSADMQQVINKLDLDQWGYGNNQANLATQVKRLAPISNGSITLSAMDAGVLALNTMGNRMASLRADNALVGVAGAEAEGRDGQWIKLVGNSSRQQATGHYDGYSARTSGLVWGTDTRLNPDTLLGLGLSATNTSVDQRDFRAGQGHTIRSYELAGYGAYQFNANVYGEASLSYANHNITGSRLTALDRTTRADYDANQITARVGLGYRHVLAEKQTLTPMVNLESSRLRTDAYNETGADALNLKFNAQSVTRNRASLGLRYLSENTTDAGTVFRPELTAEVYRDNKGLSHNTTAAFAGDLTGATFTTTGVQNDRTGYKLAAGLSILNSKTSLVQLHYGYEHRDGFASHSARIKARWDF